ncbi:hypothetical protein AB3G45_19565 [Shinella sp. S4-D37]|uniref:hypothetical protein n=1 Tax=Shinella sp. S4-D37 TaxID=3161999 RepID=UPI003467438F
MAGPWEKYKKQTPAIRVEEEITEVPAGKPWLKYQMREQVEPEVEAEPVEQGMLLPISKDADGNTRFDSDAGLLGALKRSFMLPGEVMDGKVDPLSPEGVERAFEFSSTLTPAGAAQRAVGRSVRQGARIAKEQKGTLGERMLVDRADDPTLAGKRADDFAKISAEPTAGMVSNSERLATREHVLAGTRQGKEIQKRIEGAFGAMDNEFDRIVEGTAGASNNGTGIARSRQELGTLLQDQAEAAKQAGFARSKQLYDDVTDKAGGVNADGTHVNEYLKQLTKQKKGLSNSDKLAYGSELDKTIAQTKAIVDDIKNGKVDIGKLREVRTRVSEQLYDKEISSDKRKLLSGFRDTLTKEMELTAEKAGPEAQQAFRKANNQYRRQIDPETGFGKKSPINTLANMQSPEKVAGWVMQQGKEGGTRINTLRRQIDRAEGKEAWDALTSNVVDRMGRKIDSDGVEAFDASKFVREWNSLSPEAKDALFKGTARQQYREDLDRLSRVADTMGKYNRKANHSNTAKHQSMASELNPFDAQFLLSTVVGGATLGPWGVAGAAAGQVGRKAAAAGARSYNARLLTDPKTVKWLADIPKAEMAKGGLRAHVGKLRDIARDEAPGSALAIAISEYLRDVGIED